MGPAGCPTLEGKASRGAGGQLFAIGFQSDRVEIWRADSITGVDVGDLSLLTLIRTTSQTVAP